MLDVAQYVLERKIIQMVGNEKIETFYTWGTIYIHPNEMHNVATLCISLECIYIAKNDARTFQCQVREALFHITITIFEVIKQREVNASEMHFRHLFP